MVLTTLLIGTIDCRAIPQVSIKINTTSKLTNLNAHLYSPGDETLFPGQTSDKVNPLEPVIFEKIKDIVLTRSKYTVTSYMNFGPNINNFEILLNHAEAISRHAQTFLNNTSVSRYHVDPTRQEFYQKIYLNLLEQIADLKQDLIERRNDFRGLLDQIDPKSAQDTRDKRSVLGSIWHFLFGSSDTETLNVLKDNVGILQENQGLLHEQTNELYHFINLTRIEVATNRKLMKNMAERLLHLNHSLTRVSQEVSRSTHDRNFMFNLIQIKDQITALRTGIDRVNSDIRDINLYLCSISTEKISPDTIKPPELRAILLQMQNDLAGHPRLTLPSDPRTEIWSYYKFLNIKAFVLDNILFIMLTVPLQDKSLTFDVYRIHNLPLLYPELLKSFQYDIYNSYLAIRKDSQYVAFPVQDEISGCQISAGHFCRLNSIIYSTISLKDCSYALFTNNKNNIEAYCSLTIKNQTRDKAVNINSNYWALTTLTPTILQVTCLTTSYQIKVKYPYDIVYLPNSCEATTNNYLIPANDKISTEISFEEFGLSSTKLKLQYENITDFALFQKLDFPKLSQDEITHLAQQFPPLEEIKIEHIRDTLKVINENYPYIMPIWLQVFIISSCLITAILTCLWCKYTKAGTKFRTKISNKLSRVDISQPPPNANKLRTYYPPNHSNTGIELGNISSPVPSDPFFPKVPLRQSFHCSGQPQGKPVTPKNLRSMLESGGIDFADFDTFSKKRKTTRRTFPRSSEN